MTAESPLIALCNVEVRRGDRLILDVPRLDLERGQLLGVLGPNGSGKSTLASVLALLERPSRGEVVFDGAPVDWRGDILALRRRTAMVLQEPLLFDTTVFENVATGLRFRRCPTLELRSRVESWLDRLGVAHLARRTARTLSGGEAQRTSLARALVLEPDLLILDEPFRAVDPPTREELLADALPHLRAGVTTVLITHDHDEAFGLCDRVGVMMAGRIAQLDAPRTVLERPASADIARFIRAQRRLAGFADAATESGVASSA
jgi:ABC-type sulfate/molybdate transport systems ATPase subunit